MKDEIKKIGVKKGDTLNLKVSMRSMPGVRAEDLIEALLEAVGENGTIMAESFIQAYPLSVLKRHKHVSCRHTKSYAGAFANAMINHPLAIRSFHPIQRFTAIGRGAAELMWSHDETSYAYEPLRKLCFSGGKNLNIGVKKTVGVGTTHVAIGEMRFRQRVPREGIYYERDGELKPFMRNWAGGCEEGFDKFTPFYNYLGRGKIAGADCTLTSMHSTLTTELALLIQDPRFFMCGHCIDCLFSWEQSPYRSKVIIDSLRTYNRWKSHIRSRKR